MNMPYIMYITFVLWYQANLCGLEFLSLSLTPSLFSVTDIKERLVYDFVFEYIYRNSWKC